MKIFVVVGSIFPFDRLVKYMDGWIPEREGVSVTGQIGQSSFKPVNMEYHARMNVSDFNRTFDEADLIIGHAGMGTIIKSLVAGKPIVVMPRQLQLKEHNTNHQVATANAFKKLEYVHVVMTLEEMDLLLREPGNIKSLHRISEHASSQLIGAVREFIIQC